MLKSTVYVSHGLIEPAYAKREIENLVATSIVSNARREITGALLYSGVHFAQILEGPVAAVSDLMESIVADPRHDRVTVVLDAPIGAREFENWSLVYRGPSLFIARHVDCLFHQLAASDERRAVRRLTEVMKDLTAG